MKEEKSAVG